MFTLLHHHELRSEVQDRSTGGDGVARLGELHGLLIVQHHAVYLTEEGEQFRARDVDPEVHRVADRQGAPGELAQKVHLHGWMRVPEEDELAVLVGRGHLGRSLFQHAELGEERLPAVHVVEIAATPGEGATGGASLESLQADALEGLEDRRVLGREVAAHGTDHAHGGQVTRGGGEVAAAAAEHAFRAAGGCVQRVDADRAGDDESHARECSRERARFSRPRRA